MNPGELISRERMAIVVIVLLLLVAALVAALLFAPSGGRTPAQAASPQPPQAAGPQPGPSISPVPFTPSKPVHPQPSGGTSTGHGGSSSGSHGSPHGGSTGGNGTPSGGRPSHPPAAPPPSQSAPQPPPAPPPAKPVDMSFRISGDVRGLAPGATSVIELTLTNPNSVRIRVTQVTVAVSAESSPPGCSSAKNLILHQATGIKPTAPVMIPARGTVTLTTFPRAPRIGFRNLQTSQETCKGKSFRLTYTGSAHA